MDNRRLVSTGVYKRLPDPLKKLTNEFEDREKDIVLLSSMGVLSNCLPNVYGIYDRNKVYPHLYVVIIAPPASGKGVMSYSRELIEKINDKVFRDSKKAHSDCEQSKLFSAPENKNVECPKIQTKILPANISSAEMYYYLGTSSHGLIMIESEADTMSNMFKNDWGSYSDVLRKAFHNETISISRKIGKIFESIPEPKLAMVISGTPNQLLPLIQSKENGLFSRLLIYSFDEIAEFRNVFAKESKNVKGVFKSVADEIYALYGKLAGVSPLEFTLTETQEKFFHSRFSFIREDIMERHTLSFVSSLHRHGLIMFKICMILSILRNMDNLDAEKPLICSNEDFVVALSITQTALRHSQHTFDTMDVGFFPCRKKPY